MSNVLRSTTFQLEFNGADGITGVRTFTKAVKDADATVAELNAQLGQNATVTYKTVQSKKELAQQARLVANQFERNNKLTENITEQYKNMAAMVGKTADEIEQLNAVQRLGSNATEAQKQQVLQAVQQYQQMRGAVDDTSGSFRDLRGTAQNAGWQLQDTIVQLQMGTSGFVVFSQQASQFASAFGPTGAVLGAVIALGGVLAGSVYTAMNSAAGALDRLNKLTEEYSKYLTVNAEGVTELSSKLNELAQYSKRAADEQLRLAQGGVLKAQAESLKVISKEIQDIKPFGGTLREALGLGSADNYIEFQRAIKNLKEEVTDTSLSDFADAIAMINPKAKGAEAGLDDLKQKLLDQFYELSKGKEILKDTANGWEPISKNAVDAIDEITKAFESEYQSLVKQTESTQQEYDRRKAIIDDYVKHIGKTNEEAKAAYAALDQWRATELDKDFQNFYSNIVKKTNTVDQEYDRQKAIIDDHVKRVGSVDTQAAESYAALEAWKTEEVTKEYDKRERIRRQIENAQIKQRRTEDPEGAETQLYARNMITLAEQANALHESQFEERARINALIEGEIARHNSVMDQLNLQSYQNQLALFGMAAQQMTSLVDLMSNGAADVRNRTKDMNAAQKAMFVISQTIAAANAVIAGISLGSQLAAMFPLAAPAMISTGLAIGAAQAGAIMGVTIAGAFDEGGNVPAGQFGIVSEYGDELVNGMLVKGPARVTSREDTAKLLDNAGNAGGTAVNMKVSIENNIKGAQYDVRQISPEEVKIIAKQVFDQNIDTGVSSAIANPNSKAARSMRSNYNVGRNLNNGN